MRLTVYLSSIIYGNSIVGLPDSLELTPLLTDMFGQLYLSGESTKMELGYNLALQSQWSHVTHSELIRGGPHGITLGTGTGAANFGNVHAHPGPSLGHIGGRAPHSPQDVMGFNNHQSKPVFIAFVTAGPSTNYALVYRKGITTFNMGLLQKMAKDTGDALFDYFEKHCPVTKNQRDFTNMSLARSMTTEQLRIKRVWEISHGRMAPKVRAPKPSGRAGENLGEKYAIELKRVTPGFGLFAQNYALGNMRTLARQCRFGFYASKGTAWRLSKEY